MKSTNHCEFCSFSVFTPEGHRDTDGVTCALVKSLARAERWDV